MNIAHDEKILVVKRAILFGKEPLQGFYPITDFNEYQNIITQHKEFLWRSTMETDPLYKQIIPYLIFAYQDKYFVMLRKHNASETRLSSKYSLGIGGHIRQEDMADSSLLSWARREFEEEVSYQGSLSVCPLGMINDDSNAVGQVHAGFVFLLHGDNASIAIKDEHKEGKLLSCEQLQPLYGQMERWSQLVFDFLVTHPGLVKNNKEKRSLV